MPSFHVRHDFNPTVAREVLLVLEATHIADEAELVERARQHDLEIGRRKSASKVLASLRDLGLVTRGAGQAGLALTALGTQLAAIARRDEWLFAELIHLRHWWLWTPDRGGAAFAWAYRTVTTHLWEAAPTPIEPDRLVTLILSLAEREWGVEGVSFSSSSVLGILHWLRALRPPCTEGPLFRRRIGCAPEALLVALEGCYHLMRRPFGLPLTLNAAVRGQLCQALVLEPESFEEVLTQAEVIYPLNRRQNSNGESVLLHESWLHGFIAEQEAA